MNLNFDGDLVDPTTGRPIQSGRPGVVDDDELGQIHKEARFFIGDRFQMQQYNFNNPTWIDPYVAIGASPPIFVAGGYDGGRMDIGTGGSANASAFGRIQGTKVPAGTPNWSTIANAGAATFALVENLLTSPWYLSTYAQLNATAHADPADSSGKKWPIAMAWVNSDPNVTIGQIGLVYSGSPASLRIRCSVNAATDQEQDLFWGPTAGQADSFHRFSVGFDGTKVRCLIDGVQQGLDFTGLSNIPATNNAGFPIFGLTSGAVATNYQCEWAGALYVATRIARGR